MSKGNPFRRVPPGESLGAIERETYNALMDQVAAARESFDQRAGTPAGGHQHAVVTVRNSSGVLVPRFGVLQLGDPLVTAEQNEAEFLNRITFDGVAPTDATEPFCVLLEPLPNGHIGRGVVLGAVPVLLDVQSESHAGASPVVGEVGHLRTATDGPARVLWVEPAEHGEGSSPVLRNAYVLLLPTAASAGSAAGTISVEDIDFVPQYFNINTLRFDQADGFVLSNPSAGIVRIDMAHAADNATGVVTQLAQQLGGVKTFTGGRIVLGAYPIVGEDPELRLQCPGGSAQYFGILTATTLGAAEINHLRIGYLRDVELELRDPVGASDGVPKVILTDVAGAGTACYSIRPDGLLGTIYDGAFVVDQGVTYKGGLRITGTSTAYAPGGTDVPIGDGGTGASSFTAYAVVCGGTASTNPLQSVASVGTSGQVLTSNGAGALPTFQNAAGGVTDHGALTGLADDDHAQYALLSGRGAGGQTLVGSTVASSPNTLTLRSNSDTLCGVRLYPDDWLILDERAASPVAAPTGMLSLWAKSDNHLYTIDEIGAIRSVTHGTQSANLMFAGPSGGAAAEPTFRAIAAADLPAAGDAAQGAVEIAVQSEMEAGTDTTRAVTPGRQQLHPSAAKGWVLFDGTGTPTVRASYNVTSITDEATGSWTINWGTDFSSQYYGITGLAGGSAFGRCFLKIDDDIDPAAGTTRVEVINHADGTLIDVEFVSVAVFGDQ